MKLLSLIFLIGIMSVALLGCSSGDVGPIATPDSTKGLILNTESSSGRVLWGVWNIYFDTADSSVKIEPARELQTHFNVTQYLLPPNCTNCVDIKVNSFNPVTRILDADAILKNPYQLNGYDVRGILYSDEAGHELRNADDWTGLYLVPGGSDINPFRSFAKGQPNRMFQAMGLHQENYQVYIPFP